MPGLTSHHTSKGVPAGECRKVTNQTCRIWTGIYHTKGKSFVVFHFTNILFSPPKEINLTERSTCSYWLPCQYRICWKMYSKSANALDTVLVSPVAMIDKYAVLATSVLARPPTIYNFILLVCCPKIYIGPFLFYIRLCRATCNSVPLSTP